VCVQGLTLQVSSASQHVDVVGVNVELGAKCSQNTDAGDQTSDSVNISCQLKMHQVRIHRRKSRVADDVSEEDINAVTVTGKERCSGCGNFYVNMSNHKKCSKRLLKKAQVTSRNDLAVHVPAEHVTEEVAFTAKRRRGRKPKQQGTVCTESSHMPQANRSHFFL